MHIVREDPKNTSVVYAGTGGRPLRFARLRSLLRAPEERDPSRGLRARYPRSSARQRSHPGDPRPRALHIRRCDADTVSRVDRALRRAAGASVHDDADALRHRRRALPRSESALRRPDHVSSQRGRRRGRRAEDRDPGWERRRAPRAQRRSRKRPGMHRVVWDLAGEEPRPRSDEPGPRGVLRVRPSRTSGSSRELPGSSDGGIDRARKARRGEARSDRGFGPGLARDAIPAHEPASRLALLGERCSPRARQPESPDRRAARRRSRPRRKKCPTP